MKAFFALALLLTCVAPEARASDDPTNPLTFCSFGPKIRVILPKGAKPDSSCAGSFKIQGLQWACVPVGENPEKVVEFRKKLASSATEECQRFCENRGKGCTGRFDSFTKAARETDMEEAAAAGRKLGCRKDCPGQAFAYASIYDANYLMGDAEDLSDDAPNCHCQRPH